MQSVLQGNDRDVDAVACMLFVCSYCTVKIHSGFRNWRKLCWLLKLTHCSLCRWHWRYRDARESSE